MSRIMCFRCYLRTVKREGDWCKPCNLQVGLPILARLRADKRLTAAAKKPKPDPTQNADFALPFGDAGEGE